VPKRIPSDDDMRARRRGASAGLRSRQAKSAILRCRILLHSPKDLIAGALALQQSAPRAKRDLHAGGAPPSPMFGTTAPVAATNPVARPRPVEAR